MHNGVGQNPLHFTELLEKYSGYIISWATSPSRSEPGLWMGHYHALKDGAETLLASVGNLQDSPEAAEAKAIELAKAAVDQAIAAKR